jgi:5'-nucleotidase
VTRILLTNDDGYMAPGICALREAFMQVDGWDVVVVAPDRERSAVSHAITLHKPLRFDETEAGVYKVDGTPADCVMLGVEGGIIERPNILVSGVNAGRNMGDDVLYSGTVAAAMEGTLLGIPSLAVSLDGTVHFKTAAQIAVQVVHEMLSNKDLGDTTLSLNVPDVSVAELKGTRVTRQSRRAYRDQIFAKQDPRGRAYYWIAGNLPEWDRSDGTDAAAVEDNYASLTPLLLNLTDHPACEMLKTWSLGATG